MSWAVAAGEQTPPVWVVPRIEPLFLFPLGSFGRDLCAGYTRGSKSQSVTDCFNGGGCWTGLTRPGSSKRR